MGQCYKVIMSALSQVGTHPGMTLDVAKVCNSNNQPAWYFKNTENSFDNIESSAIGCLGLCNGPGQINLYLQGWCLNSHVSDVMQKMERYEA